MVGATDFETGEEIVFDFDDLNNEEYVDAVLASASVPVVFPPTKLQGRVLIDSLSTGWNVNMISAIQKCMEIVDEESKITLDIIVMYPVRVDSAPSTNVSSTITNFLRMREIRGYYSLMSDIASFMRAHPLINYRYFF